MNRIAISRSLRRRISRPRHRIGARRPGATCVELALVAPFIFLITFGALEFCRVLMVKQALTNSAREGCRFASLATTQNGSDVDGSVRRYLQRCFARYSEQEIVTVSVTPANLTDMERGEEITTRVEVRFSDVSWLPVIWAGDAVLVGTSTMARE